MSFFPLFLFHFLSLIKKKKKKKKTLLLSPLYLGTSSSSRPLKNVALNPSLRL